MDDNQVVEMLHKLNARILYNDTIITALCKILVEKEVVSEDELNELVNTELRNVQQKIDTQLKKEKKQQKQSKENNQITYFGPEVEA